MAYLYRTRGKDGLLHEKWRFQYTDWQGCRKTGTGYVSKTETAKLAARIEAEHLEIRKGYRHKSSTYGSMGKLQCFMTPGY